MNFPDSVAQVGSINLGEAQLLDNALLANINSDPSLVTYDKREADLAAQV